MNWRPIRNYFVPFDEGDSMCSHSPVLLSITVDVDVAIIAFVKVLELLCEQCEHKMRFSWEFGLVVYIRVSLNIHGLSFLVFFPNDTAVQESPVNQSINHLLPHI